MGATPALWRIQATISLTVFSGGAPYETSRQVPTFVLEGGVHGIVDERHAARVARAILLTGHISGNAGDVDSISVEATRLT